MGAICYKFINISVICFGIDVAKYPVVSGVIKIAHPFLRGWDYCTRL
jgi:hypothetical protein